MVDLHEVMRVMSWASYPGLASLAQCKKFARQRMPNTCCCPYLCHAQGQSSTYIYPVEAVLVARTNHTPYVPHVAGVYRMLSCSQVGRLHIAMCGDHVAMSEQRDCHCVLRGLTS